MSAALSHRRWFWIGLVLVLTTGAGLLLFRRSTGGAQGGASVPSSQRTEGASSRFGKVRPRKSSGKAEPLPDEKKRALQARGDELLACGQDAWCPPGSMCAPLPDGSGIGCYASNCKAMGDKSCGPEKSCMLFDASPVYRCAPAGAQPLGATCSDEYPGPPSHVCAAGLVCWNGACRAQCDPGKGCEGKARCVAVSQRDFACVDNGCERDFDCGSGHTCFAPPLDELAKSKTCVKVAKLLDGTPGCTIGSCPRGQACDAAIVDGEFRGRCRQTCSDVPAVPCPEGFVCGAAGIQGVADAPSACYRTCEFYTASQQCGRDEVCATISEEESHDKTGCRWKLVEWNPDNMVGLTGVFTDPVPPQRK